ncbi:MAG: LacI family DNA-binding transcriptional regulator [Candidatus Limnocylindrales bacterium]
MPDTREDRPVGIRDVATRAGVSPATASRALNGTATVSSELRARVLEAAGALGYRPNNLARSLRRQRTDTIGVIVSDIANPHHSEAVRVMEDAASRAGWRLILCNTDERVDKQRSYLELLADERVGAVILSAADAAGSGTDALLDLGIPVVAFDRVIDDPRVDAVTCDNQAGVHALTEHLIGLGHLRIGFVGGRPRVATGAERLEGYRSAMRAAGLRPMVEDGEFRADDAEVAARRLLGRAGRPTAIVVANNTMAVGTLRAVREAGLAVPRDVALATVDDPVWAELVDPPLTALAQPVRAMAEAAVRLVLERVNGKRQEVVRLVLPMELRFRRSSGPPRRPLRASM